VARPRRKLSVALLLAAIPAALGLIAAWWPPTVDLERRYGLDLLFKVRGTQAPPANVCVVAIDDTSFLEHGLRTNELWPRELHAELIRVLKREGARSVAFDVLFDAPRDPEQDTALELAVFDSGQVVLGSTVEHTNDPKFKETRVIDPLPALAEAAAAVASVELPPDDDGMIRRTRLVLDDRPSLALGAYEVATGDASHRAERGSRLIDYYGAPRTIPTVSMYQALEPAKYLRPGFFRDKIVFVGLSQVAALQTGEAKDSFPTPFSGGDVGYTYGVEIHATIAANLLDGRRIDTLAPSVELLALVGLAIGAALLFLYLSPPVGAVVLVGLEVVAWFSAYAAFAGAARSIPVVVPSLIQLPTAYVASLVWYYLTTVREREKIRRAFSFYLSPEMIRRIADDPGSLRLGGEEVVGTAVFTDIRGFTSIAEGMSAGQTATMLNEYFSAITQTIFDTSGTLIKYIGDAVFALWGAPLPLPDHAARACRAALAMSRARPGAGSGTALVTRIGVHSGPMLVGNLGSSQRFDYTAIGDTVNLASRLESLNKTMGTCALISGETLAGTDGCLAVRSVGRMRVAGRAEPVSIYELLGENGEATTPDARAIARFEAALAHFGARRFDDAAAGFRDVAETCGGHDGPSEFYLAVIARLRETPLPADWDGVVQLESK
jgi:adenylate cyclase